eukprot:XP_001697675.1 predicted protein [Chlamydomonas reinhardtii]
MRGRNSGDHGQGSAAHSSRINRIIETLEYFASLRERSRAIGAHVTAFLQMQAGALTPADWKAAVGSHCRLLVSLVGAHGWAARALELDYERVDAMDVLAGTYNLTATLFNLMQTEEHAASAMLRMLLSCHDALFELRAALLRTQLFEHMSAALLSAAAATVTGALTNMDANWGSLLTCASSVGSCINFLMHGIEQEKDYEQQETPQWQPETVGGGAPAQRLFLTQVTELENTYTYIVPAAFALALSARDCPFRLALTPPLRLVADAAGADTGAGAHTGAQEQQQQGPCTPGSTAGTAATGPAAGAATASARLQAPSRSAGPEAAAVERTYAVNTYDVLFGAVDAMCAVRNTNVDLQDRNTIDSMRMLVSLLVRLMCKLRPRQAAARLAGMWRVLLCELGVTRFMYVVAAEGGLLLRLQLEEGPRSSTTAVALVSASPAAYAAPAAVAATPHPAERALTPSFSLRAYSPAAEQQRLLMSLCAWQWLPQILFLAREGLEQYMHDVAARHLSAAILHALRAQQHAAGAAGAVEEPSPAPGVGGVEIERPAAARPQPNGWRELQAAALVADVDYTAAEELMSPAEVQARLRRLPVPVATAVAGGTTAGSSTAGAASTAAATAEAGSERGVVLCGNPVCANTDGPSALFPAGGGKTCARCKAVWYCCGACQLAHWQQQGGHREACSKAQVQTQGR